jgi:hypothetical protein
LICLLSGIGLTQLYAQSNDKNINRSYAYWLEIPMGGMFPVSCDGIDFDWLEYGTKLHIVAHVQDGVFQWQIFETNWEATSSTGEIFKGKELDKVIITSGEPAIDILAPAYGTWRANLQGNMGSRYQLTFAVDYTSDEFKVSLIKAHCF